VEENYTLSSKKRNKDCGVEHRVGGGKEKVELQGRKEFATSFPPPLPCRGK